MERKTTEEVATRRRAIRLWLQGKRPCEILRRIARSRKLFYKLKTEPAEPSEVYYPAVRLPHGAVCQAMDWILRHLGGGQQVVAFHTLNLKTHARCRR